MKRELESFILKATGAQKVEVLEEIQSLWSGYGQILRLGMKGYSNPTLVLKYVSLPEDQSHPRGWNTDFSHQRKVKSYQVEMHWYQNYAERCDAGCRLPKCLATHHEDKESYMLFEDLDAFGYDLRLGSVEEAEFINCITWLACFHATFMNVSPHGLWEEGTYWHLETRPDELRQLEDKKLRAGAAFIAEKLKSSPFQTLVHGDAKLANFCFSAESDVAAVDFQYVGGGCGMKDLAYFVGSCLNERECEQREGYILDQYFKALRSELQRQKKDIDLDHLERDWRELYPWAWTDFHRFLKGWSPGHWKINSYSEKLTRQILNEIK